MKAQEKCYAYDTQLFIAYHELEEPVDRLSWRVGKDNCQQAIRTINKLVMAMDAAVKDFLEIRKVEYYGEMIWTGQDIDSDLGIANMNYINSQRLVNEIKFAFDQRNNKKHVPVSIHIRHALPTATNPGRLD